MTKNTNEHIYCGTPDCCQTCDTAEISGIHRRIKDKVSNIYSYLKGIGVYLMHGDKRVRSRERNRTK